MYLFLISVPLYVLYGRPWSFPTQGCTILYNFFIIAHDFSYSSRRAMVGSSSSHSTTFSPSASYRLVLPRENDKVVLLDEVNLL